MGFVSGFSGGVTVTLGLAYLTLLSHERNRQSQGLYLRSQKHLLDSLSELDSPSPTLSRAEISRNSSSTLIEIAKVRWNDEIENAVHWIQHTNWNGIREGMEDTVSRLLGTGSRTTRESVEYIERQAGSIVEAGNDKASSTLAKPGANKGYTSSDEVLQYDRSKATEVVSATKAISDNALEHTRMGADRASAKVKEIASTGGSVARDTVRDVISKGVEKGKNVVSKAREAAGMVVGKGESKIGNSSITSTEEETLRQRYEKSNEMSKTVEETLAERYTPIDQRNNTLLRGI